MSDPLPPQGVQSSEPSIPAPTPEAGGVRVDPQLLRSLREKDADLRAIMDNAPLAIFLKDREGRYRVINRAYTEWFGDRPEDIYGRTHFDVYPPDLAADMAASDRQVLEHGEVTYWERRPRNAKPGVEYTQVTKFPVRDERGEIVGLAGFISDVSDRKRAQEALRWSEERFRALIEHSNDIVAIVKVSGTVIYRSPSLAEGLGYTPEERVGGRIFDLVHPDDVPLLEQTLEQIGAIPGERATGRSRLRHKNGSWRHISWSARNATDIAGVDGIIVNARDVTEAHRLEEQLQQAQKMDALGRLAGGIAHDFNSIISAILGFAGFLVQDLSPGSQERGFAERIVMASERARDLVQQILAFSRRSSVERKPTDLARVFAETREFLRASLPSSTKLELVAEVRGLIADVNPAQISQILLNLCLNANDALMGNPGTVALELSRVLAGDPDRALSQGHASDATESEGRIVSGSLRSDADYARLTVADTGCGISRPVLTRIFDPFFTTKERGRGTGLGLAVVHGIVMSYDGACVVASHPGVGSVFDIYLPLTASRPTAASAVEPKARNLGHERILVVDDEIMVTDMLSTGLRRLGYETVALNDPVDAIGAFARDPWDIVISDHIMPGMSGLALYERLKAIRPALRFILCTGHDDGATEASARVAGVDALLLKPFCATRVAQEIRRLIDAPNSASEPSSRPKT